MQASDWRGVIPAITTPFRSKASANGSAAQVVAQRGATVVVRGVLQHIFFGRWEINLQESHLCCRRPWSTWLRLD